MLARIRRPGRWGIRLRITLTAMIVVGLVLVVAGAVIVVVQQRQLRDNLDNTLALRADDLTTAIVESDGDSAAFSIRANQEQLAQLVTLDGAVVAASPGLERAPPVAPSPAGADVATTVRNLPIEDDQYRILSRRIDLDGRTMVLHLGENIDDLSDSVRILTASLLIVVPLVVLLLGAVVWWLVGRTLQPVEAIRTEVATIGATELDRRVPAPDTDDEIARLASTMNAMLDRLEEAVRQQQRFVADASHELRSPLTRIRTEVEVALADNGHDDSAAILDSVLEETGELHRLVADLFHLARSDAGMTSSRREVVDLDDLVFREARRLRADGYQVDIDRLSAAQVSGDAYQLTRVVRNLLDNAARHANQLVTIELGEAGGWARLVVSDDGPGVPPADRERIFERFTRLDDARTRDHGGAGLGLAIARDIVDAHGGQLVLTDDGRSTGACFVAIIPSNEPRR